MQIPTAYTTETRSAGRPTRTGRPAHLRRSRVDPWPAGPALHHDSRRHHFSAGGESAPHRLGIDDVRQLVHRRIRRVSIIRIPARLRLRISRSWTSASRTISVPSRPPCPAIRLRSVLSPMQPAGWATSRLAPVSSSSPGWIHRTLCRQRQCGFDGDRHSDGGPERDAEHRSGHALPGSGRELRWHRQRRRRLGQRSGLRLRTPRMSATVRFQPNPSSFPWVLRRQRGI